MSGWIVNTPPCLYDSLLLLPSLYPTPPPSPTAPPPTQPRPSLCCILIINLPH
jgi:hypothetical protein